MTKKIKFLTALVLFALGGPTAAVAQTIMTLQQCIEAARKGNTSAMDAKNDYLMAREQQKYARTKYFPTVGASAMFFQATDYLIKQEILDGESVKILSELMEIELDPSDFTLNFVKRGRSVGISAIQPVYTGGRLKNYNKLADLQVKARLMQQDATDDAIVMTTEFLYYKIFQLHEMEKNFEAMSQQLNSIHQDAVNIQEQGLVNQNDVLSVELMQDQLAALRIRNNNALNLLRRGLAKHIGMFNVDIDVDTTLHVDVVAPETLFVNTQDALDNRTESHLLDIWVEKSVLERRIAKASMLPILAVGGSYSWSKFLDKSQLRGVFFVGMQLPISSFWSERHEYKRKKIAEQKAIDFRRDKRELFSLQIQDAYDNLVSNYQQIGIAENSVTRAKENLRISRVYYRNGMSNMTSLLNAQQQYQQALSQHTTALTEYLQAKNHYLILTNRKESIDLD